jgi:hypothetical protein
MKQAGIVAVVGSVAGALLLTTSPASALCNSICRAKCTLGWQREFKSEKECIQVWSRRNGPSGLGCGQKGAPFQRCE